MASIIVVHVWQSSGSTLKNGQAICMMKSWPATKDELNDYATRPCTPLEVIENLEDLEDDGETYDSIEEIWHQTIQFTTQ